ncbi:hypothetical protein [Nocardia huaxiensis]|uniref:Uncharacterized protein n=1 Tax=Nocardia huaxiensis TaxID=2755382 RepID=A0A7D6Z4B4_9NOCA|nr:hypothetical protein [Nocardia huaxiensis]QLY30824.1 hypothetical protein H0264_38065 [Nocardia huaxiensis]UFS94325.1 hypothetical protein LPY97_26650 [Nocardia huaxiensis]
MATTRSQPVPAWSPGKPAASSNASVRAGKGGNTYTFNNVGDRTTAMRIARINKGIRMKESARALSKKS